jgi:VWFA-related protein
VRTFNTCLVVAVLALRLVAQQPQQQPAPLFRGGVDLVLVDVVVRDKTGAPVKGLTADDFDLLEDGARQQIGTFAVEEIGPTAPTFNGATALSSITSRSAAHESRDGSTASTTTSLTAEDLTGHRLLTLLFDTSSMQPEDTQKAVDAAVTWVDTQMTDADLVAVASIGSRLTIQTDFTSSKEEVHAALAAFSGGISTAFGTVDSSTVATDEAAASSTDDTSSEDASAQELDTFNNDVRLRALRTLANALKSIQQKKAIIYFSAGMQRNGTDNQVELRAAVNASVRANVAIYPVDARGLQAIVPGGDARQRSQGGVGAFSGRNVTNQFTQLAAQQETLTTLASDTGGTAFTDTNDFGEAFSKVVRDISSYYILGFASTNGSKDGRFRRISVRLRNRSGLKVEARDGYYADRDFAHTARSDREAQLQDQLMARIAATDVPMFVTTGWFRLTADKYYVPITVAMPGSALPPSTNKTTVDVAGLIRDERGQPVGRIRDTLTVAAADADTLAARHVLYQAGTTLPPGRFSLKVVVRENTSGQMGAFEAPVIVPELKTSPVKISSIVLSTQLKQAVASKAPNPLAREGVELVPNLTHIVRRDQKLYFYYEVYEPALESGTPHLRTSLAFYRGKVKVFETPVVERTVMDAADRRAALFQFELPPESLKPGPYTCQVNVIDANAGRFAFPRVDLYVR